MRRRSRMAPARSKPTPAGDGLGPHGVARLRRQLRMDAIWWRQKDEVASQRPVLRSADRIWDSCVARLVYNPSRPVQLRRNAHDIREKPEACSTSTYYRAGVPQNHAASRRKDSAATEMDKHI